MPPPKLNRDQKIYIVQQLAMFERPVEVVRIFKEMFDIDITLPTVQNYNPAANKKIRSQWVLLFDETRAKFLENIKDIPIANKAFRLRELEKLYTKHTTGRAANTVEARNVLEQAAKESGDAYTNKRELTGAGGKPLQIDGPSVVLYLPDNKRDEPTAANAELGETDL